MFVYSASWLIVNQKKLGSNKMLENGRRINNTTT